MLLGDWLGERPFTLTMSSGFFSFFAHAGMLAALEEAGLAPARITGSSSGALVGALAGSGRSVAELQPRLFTLQKADFWDPAPGAGLLRGRRLRDLVAEMAAVARLEACVTPTAVSIYDIATRKTIVMDSGPLADVVMASCCVPLLFQPVTINGRRCWDGGILDRPGLAATTPDERIFYHHIASRSPWRRQGSPALQIPQRPTLRSLAIHGLPRSGPNRLDVGPAVFRQARAATQMALARPLPPHHIAIHAREAHP